MGKYQQFVYMFLSQNVHENPYLREVNVEHNKFVFFVGNAIGPDIVELVCFRFSEIWLQDSLINCESNDFNSILIFFSILIY
jgi:hypothetical protein